MITKQKATYFKQRFIAFWQDRRVLTATFIIALLTLFYVCWLAFKADHPVRQPVFVKRVDTVRVEKSKWQSIKDWFGSKPETKRKPKGSPASGTVVATTVTPISSASNRKSDSLQKVIDQIRASRAAHAASAPAVTTVVTNTPVTVDDATAELIATKVAAKIQSKKTVSTGRRAHRSLHSRYGPPPRW